MTDPNAPPVVQADQSPPPQIPWFQSPQVIAAVAAIAGGIVGFSHFLCLGFGFCILDKISASAWAMGIGGVLSIVGGGFALYRRISVGMSPTNDASRITLF